MAGATPARLASLIAAEHVLLAVAGVAAGSLLARVVAPRVAESAATVFGSVSPSLSLADVVGVGVGAAAVAMRSSSPATLVVGLKDIATRRGRAVVTVLSVGLAVTIAVAIVGLGASELDPAIARTQAAALPADPADISRLPVFPSAVGEQAVGRVLTLITAMQVLLGGVAVITLLAAAAMSIQERLRELGVLQAGLHRGPARGRLRGQPGRPRHHRGGARHPLGLGFHLLFNVMAGGGFTGSPPLPAVALAAE